VTADPNPPLTFDELEDLKSSGYSWDEDGNMIRPKFGRTHDNRSHEPREDAEETFAPPPIASRGRVHLVRADTIEPEHVDTSTTL
jgi:hypothetical protein